MKPDARAQGKASSAKELRRLGVAGLPFSRRDGGAGWKPAALLDLLEACGRRLPFSRELLPLGAQMWGVQAALARFGTPAQRSRFLRPLCAGGLTASPAVSEAGAGSDVLAMRAEAAPLRGGYALTGEKRHVTAADASGLFLVWARLPGRSGPMSLSCFLVPRGKGVRTGRLAPAGGPPLGWVRLESCFVPAAARLGAEGQGLAILMHAMNMERRWLLAPALGSMARLLDDAAKHARERAQFGRSIGEFQAVSHRLADMSIRLQASRALLRAACEAPEAGLDDARASAAKAFVSEAWVATALDAIQLRGAAGREKSRDLDEALSAALSARIMSGTNEIQKNLIAARLLAEPGRA